MTDAQEDEMAQWLKNHPEMYNKGKKEYRNKDCKEAASVHLCYNPFNFFADHVIIFILLEVVCVEYRVYCVSLDF